MSKTILAIIVTYHSSIDKLIRIFESLSKEVDIMIVDNSYPAIGLKRLISKDFCIIENNENLGVAKAFNQGLEFAVENNYRFCLLLDDDSIPERTMVPELIAGFGVNSKVFLSSPCILDKNFKKIRSDSKFEKVNWAITSGSMLNTSLIEEVGLYNEDLFIDYVDTEYALRIRRKGYQLVKCNKAYLYHRLGFIQVHRLLWVNFFATNHNHIRRYYRMRNRIYVWKEYFTFQPIFVFKQFLRVWLELFEIIVFEQNKKIKVKYILLGIRDGLLKKYGKATWLEKSL